MSGIARKPLLVIVFAGLAACASAKKSYEKGQEAESQGRYEEAADRYIDSLKRDPEYPGAREGLRVAGNRAVKDGFELAQRHEADGRLEDAVREYLRADRLAQRAAAVRVALDLPAGYEERKATVFAAATEARLAAADSLAAQGRHEAAAAAYRDALDSLAPSAEQRDRAQAGRYAALVAAARGELEAGRFEKAQSLAESAQSVYGAFSDRSVEADDLLVTIRDARYRSLLDEAERLRTEGRFQAAFGAAGRALAIHGEDAEGSAEARALRDRIVLEGTQQVVVLPVWRRDDARDVPAGLLDDVNYALAAHWEQPPPFQAAMDPRLVRGELRRLGLDRMALSARQARTIGELLQADFAVAAHVRSVRRDVGQTPVVQKVKTKDGPEAEILVYRRRTLVLVCAFTIVRVADGVVVAEGTVESSAERDLRHAVYDGDLRALLLTQEQHRWFDARRLADADGAIEREAADGSAKGLADAAFREIEKRLP